LIKKEQIVKLLHAPDDNMRCCAKAGKIDQDTLPGGTINQYRLDQEAKINRWVKSSRRVNILPEAVQFSNKA